MPTQRGFATGELGSLEVERAGLRLDLGLRLAAKAIGIDEMQLDLGLAPGARALTWVSRAIEAAQGGTRSRS